MTKILTDEEIVRAALVRLNPEMHKHDSAWYALDRLVALAPIRVLRAAHDDLHEMTLDELYTALVERQWSPYMVWKEVKRRLSESDPEPLWIARGERDEALQVAEALSSRVVDLENALRRIPTSYPWDPFVEGEEVPGLPGVPTNRRIARDALAAREAGH